MTSCALSDLDECAGKNKCHAKAQCTNTDGSYTCGCLDGYAGNGKNCTGERLCVACLKSVYLKFFSCTFYGCDF